MIRHFLKIFFASLLLFTLILSVSALAYIFLIDKDIVIGNIKFTGDEKTQLAFYESSTYDYGTSIGKAASKMKRFNLLLAGLENQRTDTLMLISYDMENKKAALISLPRDTYLPRNRMMKVS